MIINRPFVSRISALCIGLLLFASTKNASAQYCVAAHGTACSANSNINDFAITGTTLSNLGTGCTSTTAQAYTIYPPAATTTATLLLGSTYTFSGTTTGTLSFSVWIDYDHSNTFDASEWTQLSASTTTAVPSTVSITIPQNAVAGPTGLRIRARAVGSPNGDIDACTQFFSGESEDYTVTLDPGVACSGTPVAGSTIANDSTVCPGVNFNLSLSGSTVASGLTYQWESSADNISWAPVSGATFISYQTNQNSDTYYRCIVTCSGQSSTSNALLITTNTFFNCYCISSATSTAGADIGNITIATLSNGVAIPAVSNPLSVNTYSDFSNLQATALTQGVSYPVAIAQINDGATTTNSYVTIYIDYNHNGVFDLVDETYSVGAINGTLTNLVSSTLTVPFTALTGLTRMRVKLQTGGSVTQPACGTYFGGETEDYLVDILAGVVCTSPPTAGSTIATFTAGCSGTSSLLSLSGNSVGSGQTFQWQSSPDNLTWANIAGANSATYIATINASTFYQCILTCNGLSSTSSSIQLLLNPPTLCYCTTNLGGGGCGTGNLITSVEIVGTPFNSLSADTCSTIPGGTLTVYPPSGSTTAILSRGTSYTFNVTTDANNIISIFIDYDQNGSYSPDEWTQVCTTSVANVVNSVLVDIPWGIPGGLTGMRIRSRAFGNQNDSVSACINFGSGEAEDYLVTIDIGNGVNSITKSNTLSVVPNPANDFLKVAFTSPKNETAVLKLMNLAGQIAYEESISNAVGYINKTIDVSSFAKGVYFMQLITNEGISTKKIVLKN